MPSIPPPEDAVLVGPFWPSAVRVIKATASGDSVRVQAVSVETGEYFDRLLTRAQVESQVEELVAGVHTFDSSPRLFRLATEALRTHLAHVFDPQFAVSVSQVDPLPHQIEAVYRRILPLPRIRFLLADDPGAGKTIMAGLLMRELMQRQDVRRVLVLCPKALTDQWRREMWERFKQRFVLVTGETVSTAFGQNAWTDNDLVVASVDLGVQPHIEPGLDQARWDLVIFDEAHKLSAYRYGSKVEKTQRYQLAEKMAERTRHLLLMTATPHKGDPENFRLLLSLLDPDVFASAAGAEAAIDPDSSPYFLRRMKETMRDWYGRPLFLPRHVTTPPYDLNSHEEELYAAVTDYVQRGMRLADESAESQVRRNVGLALTILQRRLTSSLYAVARSLERRRDRLADELEALRKSGRSPVAVATGLIDYDDEEDDSDEAEEAVSKATAARSVAELETEVEELNRLVGHAHRAMNAGPERKLEELERVIREQTVADRAEKILIFTEHRDTLEYLAGKLRSWGNEVCVIHGGMKLQDRIAAEKQFRQTAQLLVATDAAGEGINLQFCRVMINWDLPWNPNRLEQRMGRIHRYGQQFEVQIFNLVAKNTREGQVLVRLMEKLGRMREALGNDQVFDVIQEVLDVGHVRLDTLMREAILGRRSLDEVLSDLDVLDSASATTAAKDALDFANELGDPFSISLAVQGLPARQGGKVDRFGCTEIALAKGSTTAGGPVFTGAVEPCARKGHPVEESVDAVHSRPVARSDHEAFLAAVRQQIAKTLYLRLRLVAHLDRSIVVAPELLPPVVKPAHFARDVAVHEAHEVRQLLRIVGAAEQVVVVGGKREVVDSQVVSGLRPTEYAQNHVADSGARAQQQPRLHRAGRHFDQATRRKVPEWSCHQSI